MIHPSTFRFLKDLKENNNKPWFDENRKRYETAKENFADFIDALILQFGKKDKTISHLKAKDCMFRINRDVRFSKDKAPYKTNFGAYINGEGKKSFRAGYYFHLEPGKSFTGGGIWQPPADVLAKLRQEIDYNLSNFEKIIHSNKFKTVFNGLSSAEGAKLTRVPKGYEADNPAAEYLKYKNFVAIHSLTDKGLAQPELVTKIASVFEALQPLNNFLNVGLE
ncbi:MAG TPA: DUF2461 domain-containing protein [Niabella sp.]|mgnify:CR=1 FL=1|nr:DUF2461 domain-containing protein [Niabella sp.]HOZ96194.1 DUF2461 domain-containing protein [Niabella sp.]HQW13559.1 DUF2461 domain-containing protein [Niabella sp.]HQX18953.1 DUF2461 domain-containing protein [Niabella sp.]HQX40458.1 DUF2461 domain-containing protein [Niabella sp.]